MTTTCSFLQKIGGYQTVFWINWVIIVFTAVFGLGMGGYASIRVCPTAFRAEQRLECSTLNARISMLNARISMLNAQC